MHPQEKQALENFAALAQMKINARLVSLQTALELMKTPNYSVIEYKNDPEDAMNTRSVPEMTGGAVDHVTLLAMAKDFNDYIIGDLDAEAAQAIANARAGMNAPKIVRP
jgi:hypothetical protein